jgi:hypothetical protein
MTFKRAIWYPISLGLTALNLVAVGFAAASAETWHAGIHAALALVFGLWAERLRQRRRESAGQAQLDGIDVERLEDIEAEVSNMRRELSETQERLDFTERLLAQTSESRRAAPER